MTQIADYIVGPMPVDDFLSRFLPLDGIRRERPPFFKDAFRFMVGQRALSDKIHALLVACGQLVPAFAFDMVGPSQRPFICCRKTTNRDRTHFGDASAATRDALGYAELCIDVCDDRLDDPFGQVSLSARTAARRSPVPEALKQQTAHAAEIFARQFRVFLFSISFAGSWARFVRWDRAGCVVTEAFSIFGRPDHLYEFLWRFAQLSDAGRGHDPSVAAAAPEDEARFRAAIEQHLREQLELDGAELARALADHYAPGQVAVVRVECREALMPSGVEVRRFLVSRPAASARHLVGRGVMGFRAVELVAKSGRPGAWRVVFLQDTWRSASVAETEGVILKRMNNQGVRSIPTLIAHGDVLDRSLGANTQQVQTSVTHEFAAASWRWKTANRNAIIEKSHYRLVTDAIGRKTECLQGVAELLHVAYDVYHAMRDAYTYDYRTHRAIAPLNIVLVKEPGRQMRRGILMNWDTSSTAGKSGPVPMPGQAPATSLDVMARQGGNSMQSFEDDMRSLLYTVVTCGLPNTLSAEQRSEAVKTVRDLCYPPSTLDQDLNAASRMSVTDLSERIHREVPGLHPDLKEWLDVVRYSQQRPEPGRIWDDNLARLDRLWGELLRKRTFPRSDDAVRGGYPMPVAIGDRDIALGSPVVRIARMGLRKRTADMRELEDFGAGREPKRQRIQRHS
ncbi:hypothetical protein C8Q76DRAFT_796937 [Earliella scabrosa]|nr:hypothetical protein C8Q76DRAFT_796937 [Earliella scabrosa]